jgi:MoaA/NifB/PqqE/SkfB family radical SAM enzyme
MPNVHPYVKSCEISIDAGTRETYETKTRINGDWDVLLDNLKFISTIPTLSRIKPSFVVQQKNYKEMKTFYDLMYSIFGEKVNVYFGKITNWGTFSDGEFKLKQVWNENHPEHELFKKECQLKMTSKVTVKSVPNKRQEIINAIHYLKNKKVKTKQDHESIYSLEMILKNM